MHPIYIVGDIHGQLKRVSLLLRKIGLVDRSLHWTGGQATLWFLGDFFDRGPNSIAVLEMVMRLQSEAAQVGGTVKSLIGNHEPLLMAAHFFGDKAFQGAERSFLESWRKNGGVPADLTLLTERHIAWLMDLPAMALVDDTLLVHADSLMYTAYGHTIETVNQTIQSVLKGSDMGAWHTLLNRFSRRNTFARDHVEGRKLAHAFLEMYGGHQLVHGHTPIARLTRQPPQQVSQPLIYADHLCVNVDGGLYLGGAGVVYQIEQPITT